jgi:glycine betaine/proline transport system substrate-binding protein
MHLLSHLLLLCLLSANNLAFASSSPIRILTNNWTSQIVISHITGQLLNQQGYTVEYVNSGVDEQWAALAHGINHVQMEVWEGTMADKLGQLIATGRVLDMGRHKASTREDWWYPAYVARLCPGLPDWRALQKCSSIFAREGSAQGIYIAGPWEKPEEARIRALQLNFRVRKVQTGDELWVELEKAVKQQTPIVLFNWSPNWVEARFAGAFVEFPAFAPECESNPAWGINPTFSYDCGNPKGGWLKKTVWSKLPSIWPCAAQTIRNISFDNAQIAALAAWVDVDKLTYAQAAARWIIENKPIWHPWLSETCPNG